LFGSQAAFNECVDLVRGITGSQVVAQGFALVAEAGRGEAEELFRVGDAEIPCRVAGFQAHHGAIDFRRRPESRARHIE